MSIFRSIIVIELLFAVCCPLGVNAADLQEFRMDTELFENQVKEPFLQTLTIFADGLIYDFLLTEPREVTVIDLSRGRITLLDEARKVKATVTTDEVLQFSLDLETRAVQQSDRLIAFCAVPHFETTVNDIQQSGQTLVELTLDSKALSYVALGQHPQHSDAVRSYRQFSDWAARLNATRRGNLPPGARLALNKELAERDLLPLEITKVISPTTPLGKKLELKSQHRVNWALSGEDRKRIEHAGDMLATFQTVGFDAYRQTAAKPAPTKQARR